MKTEVIESFKDYLNHRGYSDHFAETNEVVKMFRHSFFKIDIWSPEGDTIIQTFILMRDDVRKKHKKFPLWKRYHQCPAGANVEVNPAVFISSLSGDIWKIYNASNPRELKDEDEIVNYDAACDRYSERLQTAKRATRLFKRIKLISWGLATILFIYTIVHVAQVSIKEGIVQLNSSIVAVFGVILFLTLFPLIFPYIKSVSANGIDLNFKE